MPPEEEKQSIDEGKLAKTTTVWLVMNLLLSPIYAQDTRAGAGSSLFLTLLAMGYFKSLGEDKREQENPLSRFRLFQKKENDTTQTINDTLEGGATVFDGAVHFIKNLFSRK